MAHLRAIESFLIDRLPHCDVVFCDAHVGPHASPIPYFLQSNRRRPQQDDEDLTNASTSHGPQDSLVTSRDTLASKLTQLQYQIPSLAALSVLMLVLLASGKQEEGKKERRKRSIGS